VSWMDDRIKERRDKEEREGLIYAHAEEVFDALWEHIKIIIEEAKSKGLPADTNGGPRNRLAYMSVLPQRGQASASRKELHLTLDKNRRGITAKIDATTINMGIEVNADKIVGLTHKGSEVDAEQMAEMLLDRLLFWDLPPRKAEETISIKPPSAEVEDALRNWERLGEES
jgi:hypothetical protein